MAPDLYPLLFDQIRGIVDKFFDQQGQVRPVSFNESKMHKPILKCLYKIFKIFHLFR